MLFQQKVIVPNMKVNAFQQMDAILCQMKGYSADHES